MRLQVGVMDGRQAIHRAHGHAIGQEIDRKPVVRNRRPLARKVFHQRVDADLDALKRTALDPLDHPFAHLRHDQDRPYPLQRGCRHRRSRKTERQPRFAGIVDAAGSGDADLAIADVRLGQQHALAVKIEAEADVDAVEDQRRLVVVSGEHDAASGKAELPIGDVVVRRLEMRQQRDPVRAGDDLERGDQHAASGIPFDAEFRRVDRHRIIRRIAVDDGSRARDELAAELGGHAIAAELALEFAGQRQIGAVGQILQPQRQQDVAG